MQEEIMLCQCGDPSHQLIISYDDTPPSPSVYVTVHLTPERNFFKRLVRGIKYIFSNKRSIYGDFDEIILRPEDAFKLEKAIAILRKEELDEEELMSYPLYFNSNQIPS